MADEILRIHLPDKAVGSMRIQWDLSLSGDIHANVALEHGCLVLVLDMGSRAGLKVSQRSALGGGGD